MKEKENNKSISRKMSLNKRDFNVSNHDTPQKLKNEGVIKKQTSENLI